MIINQIAKAPPAGGIVTGNFTLAANVTSYEVTHNLGRLPVYVHVYPATEYSIAQCPFGTNSFVSVVATNDWETIFYQSVYGMYGSYFSQAGPYTFLYTGAPGYGTPFYNLPSIRNTTANVFKIWVPSTYKIPANIKFNWLVA